MQLHFKLDFSVISCFFLNFKLKKLICCIKSPWPKFEFCSNSFQTYIYVSWHARWIVSHIHWIYFTYTSGIKHLVNIWKGNALWKKQKSKPRGRWFKLLSITDEICIFFVCVLPIEQVSDSLRAVPKLHTSVSILQRSTHIVQYTNLNMGSAVPNHPLPSCTYRGMMFLLTASSTTF